MNNKIAIITGASRGIGKSIANKLIHEYKIYNLSLNGITPIEFVNNKNFKSYKLNINEINNSMLTIDKIINQEKKVDLFIHNAGITNDCFFHKMTYDQWFNVINTNLISIYGLCNPIINNMRKNNNGNIILISSVNSQSGCIGQTNYSSSKAGIIGFAKSLALENASKNIRVNVISPGYIKTDMTEKINNNIIENIKKNIPLGDFGLEDDISKTVSFLIDNKYITGSTIDINGGIYLR
jgi:NAD(P)-dependent dehydrogenase (short-subunit alcohol dehydrogenase family)